MLCRNPCACHAKSNLNIFEPQKAARDPGVLTILTSKTLSRRSVVQILQIRTSKSRPNLAVFNDFDFEIVLAPQRGANFAELNF